MRSMKTATVWIKDGAFALSFFLSLTWGIWHLKRPIPREFAIHGKKMLIPGGQPSGGREGWGQLDLTGACNGDITGQSPDFKY